MIRIRSLEISMSLSMLIFPRVNWVLNKKMVDISSTKVISKYFSFRSDQEFIESRIETPIIQWFMNFSFCVGEYRRISILFFLFVSLYCDDLGFSLIIFRYACFLFNFCLVKFSVICFVCLIIEQFLFGKKKETFVSVWKMILIDVYVFLFFRAENLNS